MIEKYLTELGSRGKSPNTLATYRTQIEQFLTWLNSNTGSQDPQTITSTDAVEYRRQLQGLGRKPNTINIALASIEAFCVWMKDNGYLDHNPLAKVEKVGKVGAPVKWLDKNEAYRVKRTAEGSKDKRNHAIIWTMLFSGLRVSELCELKPLDVIIGERSGYIVVRHGKGNKYREVHIPKDLRDCLANYITEFRTTGEYLFDSQRGESLTTRAIQHLCEAIGKKAKLSQKLTPHMLRHTYGHDLIKKGADIHIVAKMMGHTTLETTKIYLEPGRDELQAAADLLSQY